MMRALAMTMDFYGTAVCFYTVQDLINAARAICPELYDTCRMAKRKVAAIRRTVRFSQKVMKDIPQGSIERLIFEKLKDMKVVETAFRWKDVGNVCDLDENSSVSHSENVLKTTVKM